MNTYKQLRQFNPEELLFDEEETRIVLKFIFEPTDYEFIESLTINDAIREFTQGLLVEAIDASYAAGFIDAIFRSTANPTKGAIKILKSFGKSLQSIGLNMHLFMTYKMSRSMTLFGCI